MPLIEADDKANRERLKRMRPLIILGNAILDQGQLA
jgi:hypothetical protein